MACRQRFCQKPKTFASSKLTSVNNVENELSVGKVDKLLKFRLENIASVENINTNISTILTEVTLVSWQNVIMSAKR